MKRRIGLVIAALCFLFPSFTAKAYGQSFQALNSKVEQGGVIVFQIDPQLMLPATSNLTIFIFGKQYKPNSLGMVFVGVNLKTPPNAYFAILNDNGKKVAGNYAEIEVVETSFKKTRISSFLGKPNPRTDRQKKIIDNAYEKADRSTDLTGGLKYIEPLYNSEDIIDPFGLIYKNNSYREHGGIDLRAPVGTRVVAINSGKVVLVAKKFRREGNMVILNHGLGIFSVYMHLSKFTVKKGQTVGRGQPIALSGRTGAGVREPHLHFGIKISESYVDPLVFINKVNNIFDSQ